MGPVRVDIAHGLNNPDSQFQLTSTSERTCEHARTHPEHAAAARAFYRRRRFWAWSGVGVIGLVLLALLAVYWLLQTVAGRDVLLAQVVARLPVGASFTWDKVDGPVAGPLTLYNVDFRYDDIHSTPSARTWSRTCARCWAASCCWTSWS